MSFQEAEQLEALRKKHDEEIKHHEEEIQRHLVSANTHIWLFELTNKLMALTLTYNFNIAYIFIIKDAIKHHREHQDKLEKK